MGIFTAAESAKIETEALKMAWFASEATSSFRWAVRGSERVLQQRFILKTGRDGHQEPEETRAEWRNVPEHLVPVEPLAPKD